MGKIKIGILVGSLRKASFCRKIAKTLVSLASDNLEFKFIELRDMEMYDQDLEDEDRVPDSWVKFRMEVEQTDAVIFVTPEYNRGVPAVLKNAIDIGSRPYGSSVWDGKPGAVVSVSPGAMGAFGANHMLRQSFVFLNIHVMQQPEAYIGNVMSLYDENDKITDDDTQVFLKSIIDSFEEWIKIVSPAV